MIYAAASYVSHAGIWYKGWYRRIAHGCSFIVAKQESTYCRQFGDFPDCYYNYRFGPTIALVFVLGVAAVKAIVEDKKRHEEDFKTNSTHCHIVNEDGEPSSRFCSLIGQRI